MGAILNTLPLNETDNLTNISPNRADWLTSHADATGLAVVEVERLWNRFRQLSGSNDHTKIDIDNNVLPNELLNDVFLKNFLKHFPRSKSDHDSVPFGYFILVMQWLDGASLERKLAAIFLYLNNGEPINSLMISKLLKHVYPETKDDEVKALSVQFMRQLGGNEKSQLNQQQFIMGVQRCIPSNELEELLHFNIIPLHILDEANRLPSLPTSATNVRNVNDARTHNYISDDQLRQIAKQAANKNWSKLAITLGFLEYDIETFKIQNNYDSAATIYALLQTWREQETSSATTDRLKQYLRQSDLDELIPLLN